MNSREPLRLTVQQRIERIRKRLGLTNEPPLSGVPVRVFVPRPADIGKPPKRRNS